VAPVPSAFDRSTASVPSTTQNPCWTFVTLATSTASANPSAPRRLLRSHTDRRSTCASDCTAISARRERDATAVLRPAERGASAAAAESAAPAADADAVATARAW